MIPARRRHPYPIVMVHGGSQTGTNFTGTPDGREGWAQYFVRRGYAVYVVDQVARGRAAYWSPQVYGPVQPSRLTFTEQRFVAPERYQAMAAGASAHAVAGRRQAGRSRLRPVLRLAVSLDRELPEAAGDQPRRAGGAARQDRSGDPAHPFAIGLVQLAGRRRAAEPDQGNGRGRAERPAGARHREHRARRTGSRMPSAPRCPGWPTCRLPTIRRYPPAARSSSCARTRPTSPTWCAAGCRRSPRGNYRTSSAFRS